MGDWLPGSPSGPQPANGLGAHGALNGESTPVNAGSTSAAVSSTAGGIASASVVPVAWVVLGAGVPEAATRLPSAVGGLAVLAVPAPHAATASTMDTAAT